MFHREVLSLSLSLFFSFSLLIPQFGLIYPVSSLRLSSGHSGLVLNLRMQPTPPCPAPIRWWQRQASGLLLSWQLQLGVYSVLFFFFSSRLCCHLRFKNCPQTVLWESFLVFGNFSFTTPSLGLVSVPNSFVSVFVFYILSYLLSKRMGCVSGCLASSTSVQKLFCGSFSAFKYTFDECVWEKVVSCPIPPPSWDRPPSLYIILSFKETEREKEYKCILMCLCTCVLSHLCPTLSDLMDHSYQVPLAVGFSRKK